LLNEKLNYKCFGETANENDYLFFSYNVMFSLNLTTIKPIGFCKIFVIVEAATKFVLAIPIVMIIQKLLSERLR
jgi:hypothetical protein